MENQKQHLFNGSTVQTLSDSKGRKVFFLISLHSGLSLSHSSRSSYMYVKTIMINHLQFTVIFYLTGI